MNWQRLKDRVFFPLLIFLSSEQSKRIGLTSIDDERINICLEHAQGKVIDIGCGNNKFKRRYLDDCVGVDVHNWTEDVMVVKDSSNLSFKDRTFDTVCFIASLNHILNRKEVLKEARRILKDDGQILITMINPIIGYFCHKLRYQFDGDQRERGMKKGEFWGMWKRDVKAHLVLAGFNLVGIKSFVWGLNRLYIGEKQ